MGSSAAKPVPPLNPVPQGKTRICIAGFSISTYTGLAHRLAGLIGALHGNHYETWYYWDSQKAYYAFLQQKFDPIPFPPHLKGHDSSPFVWLERGSANEIELIGGATEFQKWVLKQDELAANAAIKLAATESWKLSDAFHTGEKSPQSTADITTKVA